jgi:hypothetical protein
MMKLFGHHHHHHYGDQHGSEVPPWAAELKDLIISNQEAIMAALDELKAAIADLATELNDNNAEIEVLLGKITAPGVSDADIAAAVQSIRDLTTANKAEVDKAKAAVG